ncbi:hypothetical protein LIER_29262 [Lithospermum erythrorhizon]|uniref:Uncharacterized protein n=1 Tax=Lithospermum erythrorhizon TaxID=34254 RepID=A0AAV3RKC3_LITER
MTSLGKLTQAFSQRNIANNPILLTMGKYSIFLGLLVILFAASFCQAEHKKVSGIFDLDTFDNHFFKHIFKKHPLFKKPELPVDKPKPKEPEKPETGKKPKPSGPKKQEKKKSEPEKKKSKPQGPKKEEPKKEQPSIKKKPCPIPKIPKKFGFPKIPLPPHA